MKTKDLFDIVGWCIDELGPSLILQDPKHLNKNRPQWRTLNLT